MMKMNVCQSSYTGISITNVRNEESIVNCHRPSSTVIERHRTSSTVIDRWEPATVVINRWTVDNNRCSTVERPSSDRWATFARTLTWTVAWLSVTGHFKNARTPILDKVENQVSRKYRMYSIQDLACHAPTNRIISSFDLRSREILYNVSLGRYPMPRQA